ncbi:hypothetical protein NPX13_g6758 [Xylaria arbuscula]|uniref:Uncharacterized protein n=1 Tax=Xylaria arbuscula TaxID=114810 RepID=A0A9W8NB93_9PEZI|nr:hypothetical protein NPX13_g6758 [Xylaria arbuscula]
MWENLHIPSSNSGIYTPSGTLTDTPEPEPLVEDDPVPQPPEYLHCNNVIPQIGEIYTIRDLASGKFITLFNGQLLVDKKKNKHHHHVGDYWIYEKQSNGWASFRNLISGSYLVSSQGRFSTMNSIHAKQYFVIRPASLGGYNLCLGDEDCLKGMAISGKDVRPKLVETETFG